MTYSVVFTRGFNLPRERDFVVVASGFPTVKDAVFGRKMSGDIVVDADTLRIAQSPIWLFAWERQDDSCYARRMQGLDLTVSR